MSESPSSTLRNTRKHFVKCVDCHTQTLPQNAGTWAAAASLYMSGRVNDGALCLKCANERRKTLGLAVEKNDAQAVSAAPASEPALKRIQINSCQYSWEVGTLETLLAKWSSECLSPTFKKLDIQRLVVAVNNELIRTTDFSRVPISDGDTIIVVVGRVAGG